jgi:hypothetical protein
MSSSKTKLANEISTNFAASHSNSNKKSEFISKAKRKINGVIVRKIENTPLQFKAYRSYWHYYLSKGNKKKLAANNENSFRYICLRPNYGAGIGHQLANWNACFYFAGYYNLKFAHFPFSTEKWENFLGFGQGEVKAGNLLKDKLYKKVYLPRFNSNNQDEIDLIAEIISSYDEPYILFILEMDQAYMPQFGTYKKLSEKFFNAASRVDDKIIYSNNNFNIAIHIRRGDIVEMKQGGEANWKDRWLDNQYYVEVLKNVLSTITISKPVNIYLFSQGKLEDFPEFDQFDNVIFCLEMGPIESFLNMANADLLISSKSSFSYKPALISKGINICPASFWHQYPLTNNFILADDNGSFDKNNLLLALNR